MEVKELILNGLANGGRTLDRTLNGLTPAEMKWQPKPDANSIQIVLFHMARLEDNTIQSRLQNKKQLWESESWFEKLKRKADDNGAHYEAADLTAFNLDTNDLMSYIVALRANTTRYVNSLQPADFDRKITLAPMGPPPPGGAARPPMELTVAALLLMLVTHLAQHSGEISYIRGLKRGMDK